MSRALVLAALCGLLLCSAAAQKVTNQCEEDCADDLRPICVSHIDTNCKPSWWGELDRCKSLKGYERVRRVMPNRCKYNCIKDQYNWEKWRVVRRKVKLSKDCKNQWRERGFAADEKCQKC
ncbi:Peptide chain release factor 1 [Chlorella sorokiniana]|uniref:Peptide chain release factor 1 n=1 Tax=Chlorella sorokiniana TaxID=3076 RepID=A0A2P6TH40_CHLSO|nr:Peptide chain release factor 1 [Chlorella sorokiniana]|eukprot:PRW33586.1 Peptide chain release factor 1 [Chlorella sorokiniana]